MGSVPVLGVCALLVKEKKHIIAKLVIKREIQDKRVMVLLVMHEIFTSNTPFFRFLDSLLLLIAIMDYYSKNLFFCQLALHAPCFFGRQDIMSWGIKLAKETMPTFRG
jgi:hypothetical protein